MPFLLPRCKKLNLETEETRRAADSFFFHIFLRDVSREIREWPLDSEAAAVGEEVSGRR